MPYEQRPNSGSAFQNTRKEKDTHADFTGSALIDGKNYWINMWVKQGAKGEFFSIQFKPKTGESGAKSEAAPPKETRSFATPSRAKPTEKQMANQTENLDEDVPF